MKLDKREIILWMLAGALCVAVGVTALLSAPDFDPVAVVYSTPPSSPPSSSTETGENMVKLNSATREELMTLDGIGEELAGRIIAYREQNNGFASIDELLQVEGIGEKRLEAIRDRLLLE